MGEEKFEELEAFCIAMEGLPEIYIEILKNTMEM
jgi:hypothetical protein